MYDQKILSFIGFLKNYSKILMRVVRKTIQSKFISKSPVKLLYWFRYRC